MHIDAARGNLCSMWRIRFAVVLLALGAGSCTITPPSSEGCDTGVLYISWTIDGKPPSATSCAGIDHLTVTIDGSCDKVSIAPVPCTLDKFEYDDLPSGSDTIEIVGVDSTGATNVVGSQSGVDLSSAAPPSPVPIPLS